MAPAPTRAALERVVVLLQRDFDDVLPAVADLRFEADGGDELFCWLGAGSGQGVSTGHGEQGVLQHVADWLQTEAMDELNGAWPAVEGVVLEVVLDGRGRAVWTHPRGPSCPVGQLRELAGGTPPTL